MGRKRKDPAEVSRVRSAVSKLRWNKMRGPALPLDIPTTFLVSGPDGVMRAKCASCEKMYEPAKPRSMDEESKRLAGLYICDPCVQKWIDHAVKKATSENGAPIHHLLLTHAEVGWIRRLSEAFHADERKAG